MKERIIVFVEDEKWMNMVSRMFIGMIGHEEELRKQKDFTRIQSKTHVVSIYIGKFHNARGHKADIVLDLVHNHKKMSADDLQEIHNISLLPIMSMSKYR